MKRKIVAPIIVLCVALIVSISLISSPASADITATYGSKAAGTMMTVKIGEAGDARIDVSGKAAHTVIRNGECFLVSDDEKEPHVARCADRLALRGERFSRIQGESGPPGADLTPLPGNKPHLVARGSRTIHGRTGTAYYVENDHGDGGAPMLVISDDPDLAPIGKAFASGSRSAAAMGGSFPTMMDEFVAALKKGAPLRYGPLELQNVDRSRIEPAEFALPAKPETKAQLRKRLGLPAPQ